MDSIASYNMAQPSICVANEPWNSLQDFGLFLRRAEAKFRSLKTVFPVILMIYALCIGVGYITWTLVLVSDVAAGNHYLDDVVDLTEKTHEFVLPSLQFINGALGLLIGFSVLTDGYLLRIKEECLYRWKIQRLPKVKYGSLVEAEKRENCCICLEGIGGEEMVRILPKCKHYFHGQCIDEWLVCQSNCPVCRSAVCR